MQQPEKVTLYDSDLSINLVIPMPPEAGSDVDISEHARGGAGCECCDCCEDS